MEPTATDAIIVTIGVFVARQLLEMAAKAIPDNATGWKAGARKLFKTLALYIPNKE